MKEIKISTEYIRLDQFLKLANIASSGGEAKYLVLEYEIFVNNEEEHRRGRKLRHGDIVTVNGHEFKVVHNGERN